MDSSGRILILDTRFQNSVNDLRAGYTKECAILKKRLL